MLYDRPDIYHSPKVSFEFFPPKNEEMEKTLWQTVKLLEPLQPDFVSVTYGAGGSTRERTRAVVKQIQEETRLKPAAHLTCVNATKEEITEIAEDYLNIGVSRIVALRGDPPDGGLFKPIEGGYHHSAEMVEDLQKIGDFDISVAAFPEVHPEAKSPEDDLMFLKQKLDAGANRAITQYFFDPEVFLRFRDKAAAAGIHHPIIPGIVLIHHFKQLISFSARCGATVPKWVINLMEGSDETPETRSMLSAIVASEICFALQKEGIDHFHFYTLNRPYLALAMCRALGIHPQPPTTAN